MQRCKRSNLFFGFWCLIIIAGGVWLVRNARVSDGIHGMITDTGFISLTISESKANTLLATLAPSDLPVTDLSVCFLPDTLSVSGIARTLALLNANIEQAYPELGALARLLPNQVHVSACFTVTEEQGRPKLLPQSFRLEQYSIPLGLLPRSIQNVISTMIISQIEKSGLSLQSITVQTGKLNLSLK